MNPLDEKPVHWQVSVVGFAARDCDIESLTQAT
jgi:hypothetical protein